MCHVSILVKLRSLHKLRKGHGNISQSKLSSLRKGMVNST
jgi:hypothetical protein